VHHHHAGLLRKSEGIRLLEVIMSSSPACHAEAISQVTQRQSLEYLLMASPCGLQVPSCAWPGKVQTDPDYPRVDRCSIDGNVIN
jgi:hypothetical protein